MKQLTIRFGGKVWENVAANNSNWIAPEAPADLVAALKKAPRVGYVSGKRCPIVKGDDGTNIYLGAAELHTEEDKAHFPQGVGSSSGTRTPVTIPLAIAKEALTVKGFSKEARDWFEAQVKEAEEAQKGKLDKALKAMIDAGIPEDVAKKTLGL